MSSRESRTISWCHCTSTGTDEALMQTQAEPAASTTFLLRQDSGAIIRLAAGTACTVSTLLCIPDGIGILPGAPNLFVWLIRMIGLWLSAVLIWTIGFSGLLFLMRSLTRGIELNAGGIKLWRFGKLIPWSAVKAISSESQPFFSKMFVIPNVFRMTIYAERFDKKGAPNLVPHSVPSFYFSKEQFSSFLAFASTSSGAVLPASANVVLAEAPVRAALKATSEKGRVWRIAMSVIILLSLVTFLGRKAALNYCFNSGNVEFRQEHYKASQEWYQRASQVDQTFAPAWDRLARSEYRQGKEAEAEKHWERAIFMKPDFVEAKIGLANIHKNHGKFDQAQRLLESALRLSPNNVAAYLNVAEVYMELGQPQKAEPVLLSVVRNQPTMRSVANLARCYLRQKKLDQAKSQIRIAERLPYSSAADRPFCALVAGEIALESGDYAAASAIVAKLQPAFANDSSFLRLQSRLKERGK